MIRFWNRLLCCCGWHLWTADKEFACCRFCPKWRM